MSSFSLILVAASVFFSHPIRVTVLEPPGCNSMSTVTPATAGVAGLGWRSPCAVHSSPAACTVELSSTCARRRITCCSALTCGCLASTQSTAARSTCPAPRGQLTSRCVRPAWCVAPWSGFAGQMMTQTHTAIQLCRRM